MRPPLWWEDGRVDVVSPVLPGSLALLPRSTNVVQFDQPLTDRDHRRLGRWFRRHPGVTLRAYAQGLGGSDDLSFLRHYPGLTGLSVDCLYDPPVLDARSLGLLPTTLRELDLEARTGGDGLERLADLPGLQRLHLVL